MHTSPTLSFEGSYGDVLPQVTEVPITCPYDPAKQVCVIVARFDYQQRCWFFDEDDASVFVDSHLSGRNPVVVQVWLMSKTCNDEEEENEC